MLKEGLIIADDYQLRKLLGRGEYSEVWLAHHQQKDIDVAIKIYTSLDDSELLKFREGLESLNHLMHPNLLKISFFGVYEKVAYLVMPYCKEGSIARKTGKMSEEECWMVLHDVAAGLAHLHNYTTPIVHQDIKPDNILISDDGHYQITDYYISAISDTATENHIKNNPTDNIKYIAPECFTNQYSPILASDIWSLGSVVYELMTGNAPLGNLGGILQKDDADIPEIQEAQYSDQLKQMVRWCLAFNAWNRPLARTIEDVTCNKLYNKGYAADQANETSICYQSEESPRLQHYTCCPSPLEKSPGQMRMPEESKKPVWERTESPAGGSYHHPQCLPPQAPVREEYGYASPQPIVGGATSPFVLVAKGASYLIDVVKNGISKVKRKRAPHQPVESYSNSNCNTFASIFAPAEVKRKSHLLVQVYLHSLEETEQVNMLAYEADKNTGRRDYMQLLCKLKNGDKVDVQLSIYGETMLMSERKSVVWQGSFTKCGFDYFVPKDIDVEEFSCVALLTVNEMPVGEMRFITKVVDHPRKLNPEIVAHKYNKVFISYSHQDESKVKFLHEGLELGSVSHFFDRKYLKAGDVFPQVIQDYINSADLFILCWSENASKSEYVQKERLQALERAFPQVKPERAAKLRIYPMSFEPRAELPSDMKEYYHFGEI